MDWDQLLVRLVTQNYIKFEKWMLFSGAAR